MAGMTIPDWNIEEMTGYKPKTTFYTDFSIADRFGLSAIKDTFNRAFKEWKNIVEYVTELVMALNWKIFEHYGYNDEFAKTYDELYRQADEWCMNNLKGEDLRYYVSTTD